MSTERTPINARLLERLRRQRLRPMSLRLWLDHEDFAEPAPNIVDLYLAAQKPLARIEGFGKRPLPKEERRLQLETLMRDTTVIEEAKFALWVTTGYDLGVMPAQNAAALDMRTCMGIELWIYPKSEASEERLDQLLGRCIAARVPSAIVTRTWRGADSETLCVPEIVDGARV